MIAFLLFLLAVFAIAAAGIWWCWRKCWETTPGSSFAGSYSSDPSSADEAVLIAATTAAVICAGASSC